MTLNPYVFAFSIYLSLCFFVALVLSTTKRCLAAKQVCRNIFSLCLVPSKSREILMCVLKKYSLKKVDLPEACMPQKIIASIQLSVISYQWAVITTKIVVKIRRGILISFFGSMVFLVML